MEKLPDSHLDVKLIAFDLDDTLLTDAKNISPDTISAIRQCARRGIYIVLCSGRVENGILPFVRVLDIAGTQAGRYIIAINGSHIFDLHTRLPVFEQNLDGNTLKEVFHFVRDFDMGCHVCDSDTVYADRDTEWTRKDAVLCGIKFECVRDFDLFLEKGHPKMLIPAPPEQVQKVLPLLREKFKGRADFFTSKPFFLEVMPHNCGKGQTILKLAELLKISADQTMAFGDSFNDETMLKAVHYGVAMKNGAEEIQKIARFVTRKSNNEDGIADFLREWVI